MFKATYSDNSTRSLTVSNLTFEVDALTIGDKEMKVTYVDEALQTASNSISVTTIEMSADNKLLNPTMMSIDSIPNVQTGTQNVVENGFDLAFSDSGMTDGKSNTLLEDNKKTINGIGFSKRLSLKAKGNTKHNVVKITTTKANAKLVVYASSSQDTGKYLFISQDADAGTVYNDYKVLVTKTNQVFEFELAEVGTYYVLADNAAYIFFMAVEYDQLDTTVRGTQTEITIFAPEVIEHELYFEQTTEPKNALADVVFAVLYDNGSIGLINSCNNPYILDLDTTVLGKSATIIEYNNLKYVLFVNIVEPTE